MTRLPLLFSLILAAALLRCPLTAAQAVDAGTSLAEANAAGTDDRAVSKPKQKIRFEFEQADWQDVIPWFAQQADFSLQPITDWPEGTFHLVDRSAYSVVDALDQLNHALRLREPPYTLIRNRNMLILVRVDQADFPAELVETIPVEKLDERGKYETLRCIFEFGTLDCLEFDDQLQQLVSDSNREAYAVFSGANQIHVRETGATLRVIRDIILSAQQRKNRKDGSLIVYRLKHLDADSFLYVSRDLLGIKEDESAREDGSLSFSAEPLSDRLFVKGTQAALQQFTEVANLVDVPPDPVDGTTPLDKPFFRSYTVTSDPKLAFDALQTFLSGREGVRMQQDEVTGSIAVMGRSADHKIVADTMAMIQDGSGNQFAIIKLRHADPSNVILTLRSLWGQTTDLEPKGPVLLGDSVQRTVIVRGTPAEVLQVKSLIEKLDDPKLAGSAGPRTRTRVIPVEDAKRDQIMDTLEEYWPSTGRTNRLKLNLVMPEDRSGLRSRLRGLPEERRRDDRSIDRPSAERGTSSRRGFGVQPESDRKSAPEDVEDWPEFEGAMFDRQSRPSATPRSHQLLGWTTAKVVARFPIAAHLSSMLVACPQIGGLGPSLPRNSSPSSSQPSNSSRTDPDYVPPAPIESVPNSAIEVKATPGGIVISSNDLDALDDMEALIRDQIGLKSELQAPTFFFLKHRYAEEVAGFLRGYFGLANASGDADGGVGGLMGGMLNNVVGGGTSDLLGGLMGGADSFGGLDGMLEGDVRFGTDSAFNTVYVTGATGVDLELISDVIDILDQPNAPQDPELLGQFRTIPIVHRDPEEVKEIIEVQLADLIEVGGNGGDGQQKGNEQNNQMMQLVQRMAGGGDGENGAGASTSERPKARLGVDTKTSQLLVTGPEFIYKEVLKMVLELDQPQLSTPPTYVVIPNGGKNSDLLLRNLKAIFGSKIEVEDSDEGSGSSSDGGNGGNGTKESKSEDSNREQQARQQEQQEQVRRQFMREFRRQQQQRGGGRGGRGER